MMRSWFLSLGVGLAAAGKWATGAVTAAMGYFLKGLRNLLMRSQYVVSIVTSLFSAYMHLTQEYVHVQEMRSSFFQQHPTYSGAGHRSRSRRAVRRAGVGPRTRRFHRRR